MTSLKSLKNRIQSIKSTSKITQAMKMVSASRLKQAQSSIENSIISIGESEKLLSKLFIDQAQSKFTTNSLLSDKNGHSNTYLLVIFTSDKGLCGPYNYNIIKFTTLEIERLQKEKKHFKLLCIGRRGYNYFSKLYKEHIISNLDFSNNKPTSYDKSLSITGKILKAHHEQIFNKCYIIYTKYISAISQEIIKEQLIPIEHSSSTLLKGKKSKQHPEENDYIFEPNIEDLISKYIIDYISFKIHNICLNSLVSEHSVRMIAMDNATNNSNEIRQKLTLVYNRTRQAQITKELIEIISGAEAAI